MKPEITETKLSSFGGRPTKGAAIILVVFFVLILMLAGLSLLHLSFNSRLLSTRFSDDLACKICADAGLEKAIGTLNQQLADGTFSDGALPISIGETIPASEGVFSYKVIKNADSNYVAYSVGARGNYRRTIMAILGRTTKSYFDYGAMSLAQTVLAAGSTASAYDSQDPSATGLKIQMGSLNTAASDAVVIKSGSTVDGDLFCGAGGNPDFCIVNGGTITGEKYALTENPEIVQPTMPAGLPAKPDLHTNGTTLTITPANNGLYNNICIDNAKGVAGKLVIDGGTVTLAATTMLKLDNNAQIVVNPGSTLVAYIAGNVFSGTGASVSYAGAGTTPDPSHIQLYGTGTTAQIWSLNAKDNWTGILYAPKAEISVSAGKSIYGAFIGYKVLMNLSTGYGFYYDVNLSRATNIALSGPADFTIKRWTELGRGEIPDWAQ
jgi:hypothetical protein